VPPESLGDYLRDFRALLESHGYGCALYGHFGQGCVHTRIDFELRTRDGIDRFRSFVESAADLVVRYGGSLSGEHGDGQARAELLPRMFGEELCHAFSEFKALWDPAGRMNPGKVVAARPLDADLRLGTTYRPEPVETRFTFRADHGDFAETTRRCVGVGKCRRHDGGTMCPSYMVTREEAHSTRGRARLLFEMLEGDAITDGWRSGAVRDALDLCLACKGCKADCPVGVDMATYKAEFLSHFYRRRLRPRSAYAFGLIGLWSRFASRVPRLANFATRAPGSGSVARWLAGATPERSLPRFSTRRFRTWFDQRALRRTAGPRVLLWPDTFNEHFRPHTAMAAVEVLEALGYCVSIPERPMCCGRPLYDYGMLGTARRWLAGIVETLQAEIEAGVPLVVLEPSCAAVFRDELPDLLSRDQDAHRLAAQTRTLGEFVAASSTPWPDDATVSGRALVQPHCHAHAVLRHEDEESVLRRTGLDLDLPDAGCCGMAGAFGFEREHYAISMEVGERVLLPAVRAEALETLIVADGFSCREQIAQGTPRRALHLAEVLHRALRRRAGDDVRREEPELEYWGREEIPPLAASEHARSAEGPS
jgi:Fe-S oxidoreductase